jgi:hypothetical protein
MHISNATATPDLDHVRELNRLFLSFLRTEARNGRFCLGLPEAAMPLLREATDATLDRAALLPRALFRLRIRTPSASERLPTPVSARARAEQSLQLTILLTIWHVSRESAYRARAFFGLTSREVQELRAWSLSELPQRALGGEMIACSFDDVGWLWRQLLSAEATHEHLKLVALQPARRPSRASP